MRAENKAVQVEVGMCRLSWKLERGALKLPLGNGKPEGDIHIESRRLNYSGECTDLWYKQSIAPCGSEETRDVSEAGRDSWSPRGSRGCSEQASLLGTLRDAALDILMCFHFHT